MKLAIAYEGGQIPATFDHPQQLNIYDIQDAAVGASMLLPAGGRPAAALAGLLRGLCIRALLCGAISPADRDALEGVGIAVLADLTGPADEAAQAVADGRLVPEPVRCCDTSACCGSASPTCTSGCCGGC